MSKGVSIDEIVQYIHAVVEQESQEGDEFRSEVNDVYAQFVNVIAPIIDDRTWGVINSAMVKLLVTTYQNMTAQARMFNTSGRMVN